MEKQYLGITIARAKESIITRSIEKRLRDEGHHVDVFSSHPEEVEPSIGRSDVFILYLSGTIRGDQGELMDFATLLHDLKGASKKAVVIGEEGDKEVLMKMIPDLRGNIWVSRPIDIDGLVGIIEDPKTRALIKERTILIVDDDPTFAKMIREWLKDSYKVNVVTAGMQAITFLMKNEVDLILLDYEMPIVDGPQVLEMLRSEPATELIPVVFLTGVKTKEGVSRAAALKPEGYLLKSTPRETLMNFIQDFFDKH